MSKLIALYKRPSDPQAFDLAYFSTHLPLISHLPGLERIAVTRFTRTVMGEDWYLMAEMVFADRDSLKNSHAQPRNGCCWNEPELVCRRSGHVVVWGRAEGLNGRLPGYRKQDHL